MAISLNGSTNIITGVAVGGLPDGIVDTDMLAANAVSSAKLASGAGGKILQVVTTSVANSTTTGSISVPVTTSPTSDSYGELTHFALTITPTSATSKILISAHIFGEPTGSDLDYYFNISLKRVISGGSTVYIPPNDTSQNQPSVIQTFNVGIYVADQTSTPSKFSFANLMDEPNTTSAVTYTPVMRQTHTGTKTFYYNRTGSNTNQNDYERGKSFVTLMEVAA